VQDLLSPGLAEADLMRLALPPPPQLLATGLATRVSEEFYSTHRLATSAWNVRWSRWEGIGMSELLDAVLEAHGGLERWRRFSGVEATIVTGGEFWGMKGLVQDADPRRMTVALHEEWASVQPFGAPDQKTEFTRDRIAIEKLDGQVVAERADPRQMFVGHEIDTPWRPLHRAYFNGYALWTYLTTPFLLAMPGFSAIT
jgi:hypothetical protein